MNAGVSPVSGESQSHRSEDVGSEALPPTLAERHLGSALSAYASRYSTEHERSTLAIMVAVCEVVDDMRLDDAGPVAVILVVKRILATHPSSISIHPAAVRRCIERYYE